MDHIDIEPRNPLLVAGGMMLLALGALITVAVLASGARPLWLLIVGLAAGGGGALALSASRRAPFPRAHASGNGHDEDDGGEP